MISRAEIGELSVSERLQLAQDLWDSIVQEAPESVPVTEEQKEELDRRLEVHHLDPDRGSSWSEVKGRIRQDV